MKSLLKKQYAHALMHGFAAVFLFLIQGQISCLSQIETLSGSSSQFVFGLEGFSWLPLKENSAEALGLVLNMAGAKTLLAEISGVKTDRLVKIEIASKKRGSSFEELSVTARISGSSSAAEAKHVEELALEYCRIRRFGFTDPFAWGCLKAESAPQIEKPGETWRDTVHRKIPLPDGRLKEVSGIYGALFGLLRDDRKEVVAVDERVSLLILLNSAGSKVEGLMLIDSKLLKIPQALSKLESCDPQVDEVIKTKFDQQSIKLMQSNGQMRIVFDEERRKIMAERYGIQLLFPAQLPQPHQFW